MKVYIVTSEPYHDNSSVLGVYASLELAKQKHPGPWIHDGFYCKGRAHPDTPTVFRGAWPNVVAETNSNYEGMLVYEFEVVSE